MADTCVRSLLVGLLLAARPVAAQCDGKTVSAIAITPHDPSFVHLPRPLRALARGVGLEHTTTKADVIRRFLLLDAGQSCTAIRVAESQRILRLQPFLAEATVRAVPDTAGGVRIEVETLDEIPTVFSLHLRRWRPAAVLFGNGNVGGRALYVAALVEQRTGYRTGAGVQLVAYQAFNRPYTLALANTKASESVRPPGTVAISNSIRSITPRRRWGRPRARIAAARRVTPVPPGAPGRRAR